MKYKQTAREEDKQDTHVRDRSVHLSVPGTVPTDDEREKSDVREDVCRMSLIMHK